MINVMIMSQAHTCPTKEMKGPSMKTLRCGKGSRGEHKNFQGSTVMSGWQV